VEGEKRITNMTYDEFLWHLQYKIEKKYKVISINCGTCGMRINFKTHFSYGINDYMLKGMWNQDLFRGDFEEMFSELCEDIEKAYVDQIRNI
jgi:hypothetical protein